ncbi:MAG: Na+/H+ antiporter subunit E [Candidatus Promineifilaceae bacterium]|jgi:multicomponent Na+:H+ antiporter subunit E
MNLLRGTLLLTIVYLALTANFQLSNIFAGLLLGLGVMILLSRAGSTVEWRFSPGGVAALVRYIFVLTVDLALSGIQVARIVLSPRLPIEQGNVAIPTSCETPVAQALSAHAITVTPGEMVVEMTPEGTMYTHVLDTSDAVENIKRAQEMREKMLEKIAL